jgi:hypothetical protein
LADPDSLHDRPGSDDGPVIRTTLVPGQTFFGSLKAYVGFDHAASATLAEVRDLVAPHFRPIIDDFYATIEAHPGAPVGDHRRGGPDRAPQGHAASLARRALPRPARRGLFRAAGPHRAHPRADQPLPGVHVHRHGSHRVRCSDVLAEALKDDPAAGKRAHTAMHQMMLEPAAHGASFLVTIPDDKATAL